MSSPTKTAPTVTFLLALLAFVSLGLPDAVQGVAWPSVRRTFDLPLDRLGMLFFSMIAGGLTSSFLSGTLVRRFGVGGVLIGSCVLVTTSAAGYALAPVWLVMVLSALCAGLGAGAIDAGINTYAATRFHPGRVAWLHASWGIGAMLGPLVMTAVLSAGLSWRWGYAALAAAIATLSIAFFRTRRQWDVGITEDGHAEKPATLAESLRRPIVWASALLFFVYTGVEATAGQWAYSLFTEARGMAGPAAGVATSVYWGSLTASRVLSGILAHHIAPARLLRVYVLAVPIAAGVVASSLGPSADVVFLALIGFGCGPIFPFMIASTPERLGATHSANGVGIQVASAGLGFAVLPSTAGVLARAYGLEAVAAFLGACAIVLWLVYEGLRSARSVPSGSLRTTATGSHPA
jgi:fucose permease